MSESPLPQPDCPTVARVTGNVPMVHVVDVDAASRFYALLGFACESRFSAADGTANWCALASGGARLFLSRASGPVAAEQQAVLLYMYSPDVRALRAHLLARGVIDGGATPGEGARAADWPSSRPVVFDVEPRFYMPQGELRLHDPDGYVVLVGQLG
ncbi:MAG: hypothetical protein R3F49_24050 [Planctomycetota bacterium]